MSHRMFDNFRTSSRLFVWRWWFVLMGLACGWSSISALADEPRSARTSLLDLDSDTPQVFETPFGKTRGFRAADESERSPFSTARDASGSKLTDTDNSTDQMPIADARAVPLTKPTSSRKSPASRTEDASAKSTSAARAGWSSAGWWLLLGFVAVGLGIKWLGTRGAAALRELPSDVLDVLGRKVIDQRTSILLVRCGSRLLVLSLSQSGLRALSEITDPVEIDCLAGLCHSTQRDHALTETFRSLLNKPSSGKGMVDLSHAAPPAQSVNESRWPERLTPPRSTTSPITEARP